MIKLNKNQILEYQRNREPYLFLDYVTELVPASYANGYKYLSDNEWFFKVHWKNDPNMPGLLQIEALVQLCALTILSLDGNKGKLVYLVSADKIRLYKKVVPGDKFEMKTILKKYTRGLGFCEGKGYVNGSVVCEADFKVAFLDDFPKM